MQFIRLQQIAKIQAHTNYQYFTYQLPPPFSYHPFPIATSLLPPAAATALHLLSYPTYYPIRYSP